MSKFCGKCGTEIKDGKCPKCDKTVKKTEKVKAEKVVKKTETKNVEVINEKASFAWAVLGFFVPIAGLVLFIVFMNKRKDLSKKAGIGALVGVIKNIIVIILSYVLSFISFYSLLNFIESNPINVDPIINDVVDIIEEKIEDNDINVYEKEIELSSINTDIELPKRDYKLENLKTIESTVYKLEDLNLIVTRNNTYLEIKNMETGEVYKTFNNVLFAKYTSFDCSGWDTILVEEEKNVYAINLKTLEIHESSNRYNYFSVANHSYTCGGSHILVGKDTNGDIYDLYSGSGILFENLYYYDDSNNWINYITRGYILDNHYGTAKAVIKSSEGDALLAVVDVTGVAYIYTYDQTNLARKAILDPLTTSEITATNTVKKIKVDEFNNKVTLVYDNGAEYKFEYAELEY